MHKEIAVYVNNLGKIGDLNETGTIKIFSKDCDKWTVVRELLFKFHSTESKNEIRLDIINVADILGNCKIFVAKELPDLIFTMLNSIGLSTWKMDGELIEILNYVLEKEEKEEEEVKIISDSISNQKKQIREPVWIGNNGCCIFNLKELQEHNSGITSKQALKPLLKNENFNELIVTCSHIPPWIVKELEELNFKFEFLPTEQGEYIMIISPERKNVN